MKSINFYFVPQILLVLYLVGMGAEMLNFADGWRRLFLVAAVLLAATLRIFTLMAMFRRGGVGMGMHRQEILYSLLSHALLFSSLFILFKDDYTIPNPTNTLTDSLYFTTDILSTVGTSDIKPVTTFSKTIGIFHHLDAYLLLLLIGYEIVFALRDTGENRKGGSRGKA